MSQKCSLNLHFWADQKFKYNGIELEEGLDLNLYEMDVRSYDPAIARFTSIDPVVHHYQSTYTAFDNNPIYWADPSGANSQTIYDFEGNAWAIDCENGECGNARRKDNGDDQNGKKKKKEKPKPTKVYVYTNDSKELKLLKNSLTLLDITKNDELIGYLLGNWPNINTMSKGEVRAKLVEIALSVITIGKSIKAKKNNSNYLSEGINFELIPITYDRKKEFDAMDRLVEYEKALQSPENAAEYVDVNNLVLIFSDKRLINTSSPLDLKVKGSDDYSQYLYDDEKYPNLKYMYMGINSGFGNVYIINEFKINQ